MSKRSIENMFTHHGKTVDVIGKTRVKTYHDLYNYLTELQNSKEISVHDNYLGDNVLAINIYKKKYLIKDLNCDHIEKTPEDVFKRLGSFLAHLFCFALVPSTVARKDPKRLNTSSGVFSI